MKLPVVDGQGIFEVEVSNRSISKAKKECAAIPKEYTEREKAKETAKKCAIAQSIKQIPGVTGVRIGKTAVFVHFKDRIVRWALHPEDKKKIEAFDHAKWFQAGPVRFIEHPTPLGSRSGEKCGSNKREGKARTVHNAPMLRHA